MIIPVKTASGGYDIVLQRHALGRLGDFIKSETKTLLVTDDGVPDEYAAKVSAFCRDCEICVIPQGERSKSFETLTFILQKLVNGSFNRKSRVIALGGGVVGDLAGFAASVYMRGIEFINIPTTLLAQIDSSVGGKTAIDFSGIKNVVGSFYQPSKVIIDSEVLKTLPRRQIANGLAEALKMGLTCDKELFDIFEKGDPTKRIDEVIKRCLNVKISIVEKDEKESGLRRVLNFGHTVGHGIESAAGGELLHGECVAIGMLPMCSSELRLRLKPIYKKMGWAEFARCDKEKAINCCFKDKKSYGGGNTVTVRCDRPGSFEFRDTDRDELAELIAMAVK